MGGDLERELRFQELHLWFEQYQQVKESSQLFEGKGDFVQHTQQSRHPQKKRCKLMFVIKFLEKSFSMSMDQLFPS